LQINHLTKPIYAYNDKDAKEIMSALLTGTRVRIMYRIVQKEMSTPNIASKGLRLQKSPALPMLLVYEHQGR
jgi:hypothetical protein